ncbi:hypothetical protein PoB_003076000 [Plakobranchus ocellatus]|uniref:Uncharacterized protein n=1 Tax=Plakobranchus ocellatus TaxID=259542 RepID=A0AAV4A7V4_9GAST|nr:hypothetical protein PoB_003076000 [Plakobranchus ocellatus]
MELKSYQVGQMKQAGSQVETRVERPVPHTTATHRHVTITQKQRVYRPNYKITKSSVEFPGQTRQGALVFFNLERTKTGSRAETEADCITDLHTSL